MGDDGRVMPVDEADDLGAGMFAANAEVFERAAVAERDGAVTANDVVSGLPDIWGVRLCRCCFGDQVVGERWRPSCDCPVWSDLVVERSELVEVVLQHGEGVRGMLGEEAFQRLPEPFNFALCGGFIGAPVLLGDAL